MIYMITDYQLQEIMEALSGIVDISLKSLNRAMKKLGTDIETTAELFRNFAWGLFTDKSIPYHKTSHFRQHMYYRRYRRNSHRSNKPKKYKY